MNRTCRELLVSAAYIAVFLATLLTALTAFAQDTVALNPGAVAGAVTQAGLPPWAVTLITVAFTVGSVLTTIWRLVGPFLAERAKKEGAEHTFLVAGELAASVVADVETRLKPLWVQARADGVVTPDEAKKLKDAAFLLFMEIAPEVLKKALGEMFPSESGLKTYIGGLLERANAASAVDAPGAAAVPDPAPTRP